MGHNTQWMGSRLSICRPTRPHTRARPRSRGEDRELMMMVVFLVPGIFIIISSR